MLVAELVEKDERLGCLTALVFLFENGLLDVRVGNVEPDLEVDDKRRLATGRARNLSAHCRGCSDRLELLVHEKR